MSSIRHAPTTRCWRLPRLFAPIFRSVYHLHHAVATTLRWIYRAFYAGPLFRGRCDSVGAGFDLTKIPDINGHCHLMIGNNVRFRGHVGVGSGRVFDQPQFVVGDGVELGHDAVFTVNREVRLDNGVRVGAGSRFLDTDGHPRDAALRAANVPPPREEIKPVHVCANVAIGRGSFVLKGVTIGEAATVGVGSVVVADIPPYAVAAGNPARILSRRVQPKEPSQP